jgi:predicted nucleotidyltransferase
MKHRQSPPVSGRFLLRMKPDAHARLQAAARESGVSLNELCSRRLHVPGPAVLVEDGAPVAVGRALALFGADLVGVLVYGSYARGDATPSSDVDLLVVIDASIPLTRSLYRDWDAAAAVWDQRPTDPHFVHAPSRDRPAAGAWCEAAIDGVVLFERDGAVTRHLAAIRGDIAAGRIARRSAHGQPYWTAVA